MKEGQEGRILTLLTTIESSRLLTQRALADELEVALGTANHLLHSLKSRKLIAFASTDGRMLYRLTPLGVNEKLRLRRRQMDNAMDRYSEIRNHISMGLESLDRKHRRIVFYGAGEVAQIAYAAMASGDFELIGVVDDEKVGQRCFGHEVVHPSALTNGVLNGVQFDTLVLVALTRVGEMKETLERMEFPSARVLTLFP